MRNVFLLLLLLSFSSHLFAQSDRTIRVSVVSENKTAMPASTVYLLTADSVIFRTAATNAEGTIEFTGLEAARYRIKASAQGHEEGLSQWIDLEKTSSFTETIILKPKSGMLQGVTVETKKPFV